MNALLVPKSDSSLWSRRNAPFAVQVRFPARQQILLPRNFSFSQALGAEMSEETSTSSSAAPRPSLEDIFRSSAAVNSAGDSSASVSAQTLHFSCGNPRIEEIRGVMRLYRDDVASSSSQLPVISLILSLIFVLENILSETKQ